jgi:hypothetical protein
MSYREDFYKFSHYFLPNKLFNSEGAIINRKLKNKEILTEALISIWQSIEIEDYSTKNILPEFSIEVRRMDNCNSIIVIKIPEAREELEALYIGIIFDKNFKIRYFTYEIGVNSYQEKGYYLFECTINWENINYGFFKGNRIEKFINYIEEVLIYELF